MAKLPADIDAIINVSRENNQREQITGCLVFDGECFAQVLEGPAGIVWERYMTISKDARHSGIELLRISSGRTHRSFGRWDMAFFGYSPMAAYAKEGLCSADADRVLSVSASLAVRG